jgi:DnaJ family protein C protein 28
MSSIDEIIQQAMRDGAFDNLPGKGKPLNLDENPYLDREWQLAYHLLKENGFAPDFIEQRQSIELELAAVRETLARAWAWRNNSLTEGKPADWVEAEWGRAKKAFENKIETINNNIRMYNLAIPYSTLHKNLLNFEQEMHIIID